MSSITRRVLLGASAAVAGAAGAALFTMRGARRTSEVVEAFYAEPLSPPQTPLNVYHLGHSLVGRDMPAMLAQLAGTGHGYAQQLGWGTSLKEHWDPDLPVNGFTAANDHPQYRPAKEALVSGDYDTVVLTEMVEIRDAIRYHDSAEYLTRWAKLAQQGNPAVRVYLYETWHHTDDGNGWLERIDRDLTQYWQGQVKFPALENGAALHLIPAGQVMAAFVRAVNDRGGVAGIAGRDALFGVYDDGRPDTIHFNDLGAYLVALTHYAVLYHRNPEGLPHALLRADGTPADAPSAEAAALMQRVVWQVVTAQPTTGVAA
jgi:hypothetical protein